MLCHPTKIKLLPKFKKFRKLENKIQKLMYQRLQTESKEKNKALNVQIKKLKQQQLLDNFKNKRIFIIPPACNSSCLYWNECQKEVQKTQIKSN